MTDKFPNNTDHILQLIGQQVRNKRKALRISAVATAEAAGISRVTLHRIERGEPGVNIGAYVSVMLALGMQLSTEKQETPTSSDYIPVRIKLDDYPALKKLAWQIKSGSELTAIEALDIYQRNWRYLDQNELSQKELSFINALKLAFTKHTLGTI